MNSESKHLIIGGDSVIARRLAQELTHRGVEFATTTRKRDSTNSNNHYLDLESPFDYTNFGNYEVVYFLAGVNSVKQCELEKEKSHEINFTNTTYLLNEFLRASSHVVFPSSNHVFDGFTPRKLFTNDEVPQSYYGKLKKQVENHLFQNFVNFTIVRFSKVLSPGLPILTDWHRAMKSGGQANIKDQEYISPITIDTACRVLANQGITKSSNLVQLSAPDDISYGEIFDIFSEKFPEILNSKIRYMENPTRPIYGSMANFGLSNNEEIILPPSRELVKALIDALDFQS